MNRSDLARQSHIGFLGYRPYSAKPALQISCADVLDAPLSKALTRAILPANV
jgi:hypothetical protein